MRIFISYSGKHGYDGYVADSIAAALALRKVEYFYDRQSIRVGDDILRAIQQAIDKSCTHFLILASFASDKADWPHRELEMAVQRGLSLIPMAIAARENDVPELLRNMKRALFAPLRSEVATLFEYLGLGPPPDLEKAKERDTASEFLPALCDRRGEQTLFERALDDSERKLAGAPKFFCLLGDFRARPELFVARLREGVLATSARFLSGGRAGAPDTVRVATVDWDLEKWSAKQGLQPVIDGLFRTFNVDLHGRRLDKSGLAALVAGLRESVVVIIHPMPLNRWLPETAKRLTDYLALWRDAARLMRDMGRDGKTAASKEVIVLFTVSWPRLVDQAVRERVEMAVAKIEATGANSRTRPLFTPIRFSTVDEVVIEEWANTFTDKLLALRTKKYCRDLFEAAPERQLGEVIDQFTAALIEQQEKSA